MRRIETLPPAFQRYRRIGGVLDFAVFEDADGSERGVLAAVVGTLGQTAAVDLEALRSSPCHRIDRTTFFGDWYDSANGALIRRGSWTTDAGKVLRNPRLSELDQHRVVSGGGPIPAAGSGGQFAFAFAEPPYALQARPCEVQAVFDQVCAFIIPPAIEADVLDWSSDRLTGVSEYFAPGMEWWGVFLFSIHVPALQRLTIVAGSSTD